MATEKKTDDAPVLLGRLVLATGKVVSVPAENVSASTEHFDDDLKATVPVTGRFVLTD